MTRQWRFSSSCAFLFSGIRLSTLETQINFKETTECLDKFASQVSFLHSSF